MMQKTTEKEILALNGPLSKTDITSFLQNINMLDATTQLTDETIRSDFMDKFTIVFLRRRIDLRRVPMQDVAMARQKTSLADDQPEAGLARGVRVHDFMPSSDSGAGSAIPLAQWPVASPNSAISRPQGVGCSKSPLALDNVLHFTLGAAAAACFPEAGAVPDKGLHSTLGAAAAACFPETGSVADKKALYSTTENPSCTPLRNAAGSGVSIVRAACVRTARGQACSLFVTQIHPK